MEAPSLPPHAGPTRRGDKGSCTLMAESSRPPRAECPNPRRSILDGDFQNRVSLWGAVFESVFVSRETPLDNTAGFNWAFAEWCSASGASPPKNCALEGRPETGSASAHSNMHFYGYIVHIIQKYASSPLQGARRPKAGRSGLPHRVKKHPHLQVQPAGELGIAPVDGAIELPGVQGDS